MILDVAAGTATAIGPDGGAGWPSWNPAGTSLAFEWNDSVAVMNAAGSAVHVIQADQGNGDPSKWSPSWAANGARIAYVRGQGEHSGSIYVMNSTGAGAAALTDGEAKGEIDSAPDWSPSSKRIAFQRYVELLGRKLQERRLRHERPQRRRSAPGAAERGLPVLVACRDEDPLRAAPRRQQRDLRDERKRHRRQAPDRQSRVGLLTRLAAPVVRAVLALRSGESYRGSRSEPDLRAWGDRYAERFAQLHADIVANVRPKLDALRAATLPDGGPSGGFFRHGKPIPW